MAASSSRRFRKPLKTFVLPHGGILLPFGSGPSAHAGSERCHRDALAVTAGVTCLNRVTMGAVLGSLANRVMAVTKSGGRPICPSR